jgi:hypothetical protein
LRKFILSGDTIRGYKETKNYDGKEISDKYFDANKNLTHATTFSHNVAGYINAISYIGISGNPYRNPYYKYSAYKLKYSLNNKGIATGYAAYNEFGEKSYARYFDDYEKKNYVFHKYDINNFYKLNGTQITDMVSFVSNLNYLYFIYLLPETQQNAKEKLRDGDIIISYGSWKYDGFNLVGLLREFERLSDSTKIITLLRLPEKQWIDIEAPPDNFGIGYDYFYLTENEHKRIMDILELNNY